MVGARGHRKDAMVHKVRRGVGRILCPYGCQCVSPAVTRHVLGGLVRLNGILGSARMGSGTGTGGRRLLRTAESEIGSLGTCTGSCARVASDSVPRIRTALGCRLTRCLGTGRSNALSIRGLLEKGGRI